MSLAGLISPSATPDPHPLFSVEFYSTQKHYFSLTKLKQLASRWLEADFELKNFHLIFAKPLLPTNLATSARHFYAALE